MHACKMHKDHEPCRALCTQTPSLSCPHIAPGRTQQTSARQPAGARVPAMSPSASLKQTKPQTEMDAKHLKCGPATPLAACRAMVALEVQSYLRCQRSRCYIVRSAEGGEKVV